MKTVNLLPLWYLQQHRQKRNLRVHVLLMLALIGAMFAAWGAGEKRVEALGHQRAELQTRLNQIADPQPELQVEQANLARLENLELAYNELGKTIPMSGVIQQIQNDMAPGMALFHLAIEVKPDPVKGSGVVGDTRSPPKYHDVAYLTVEGIAPDDTNSYQLLEKLNANPLFTEVTLDYTRGGTLQAFLVRRFQMRMKMDLDRLTTQDPDVEKRKLAAGGGGESNGQ